MRFGNLTRTVMWLLVAVASVGVSPPVPAVAQPAMPAGGPGFEHVHALAVAADGRTLWLGAHAGLFRSQDGGRTWQSVKLSDKSSHLDVMTLIGDPRDSRTVYVGTHEAGVFRTRDGGGSWAQMNNGIGGLDVHGLALDPNEPAKVHARGSRPGRGGLPHGGRWREMGPRGRRARGRGEGAGLGEHLDRDGRDLPLCRDRGGAPAKP